jgi:hypothetical protein
MLNTLLQYVRDAKKIGGQAGGQASVLLLPSKCSDSLVSMGGKSC